MLGCGESVRIIHFHYFNHYYYYYYFYTNCNLHNIDFMEKENNHGAVKGNIDVIICDCFIYLKIYRKPIDHKLQRRWNIYENIQFVVVGGQRAGLVRTELPHKSSVLHHHHPVP